MRLMNVLKNVSQGYGTERRIILLHGPVGSAKSTIARQLKKGIEDYSRTPDGALYTYYWTLPGALSELAGGSEVFSSSSRPHPTTANALLPVREVARGEHLQRRDVVDLVDTQRADGRFSFEDQGSVALARRRAGGQLQKRRHVENGQDRPVEIAQAAEQHRSANDEADRDDLANPPQLDQVTCGTDREHDHVAQVRHAIALRDQLAAKF